MQTNSVMTAPRPIRIAIMHHARSKPHWERTLMISRLAACWKAMGCEVLNIRGPWWMWRADVLVLHVNLSVVPWAYRWRAGLHGTCINGALLDIRKSSFSTHMVRRGDDYAGPVIVKTNLNYGGKPEWLIHRWRGEMFEPPVYQIYKTRADVPDEFWGDSRWVVERYLPQKEGDSHVLYMTFFLGDRHVTYRVESAHAVVKTDNARSLVRIPTPPEALVLQKKHRLDYGKMDYAFHEGQVVLYDINKTIGASATAHDEDDQLAKNLAPGIFSLIPSV
jgi:hypothetical protein